MAPDNCRVLVNQLVVLEPLDDEQSKDEMLHRNDGQQRAASAAVPATF